MTYTQDPDPSDKTDATLDRAIADLLVVSVMQLRQAANSAFEPLGLNTFQTSLLNLIVLFPESTPSDLSERLGVIPVSVSAMLTQLEQRGLVERSASQADERKRTLHVTEEGETARLEALRLWTAVTTDRYKNLSKSDKENMLRYLNQIHAKES